MNGFINIIKPPGMSSAAVVGVVRHMVGKHKVGHMGTLDPEASGVLPLMIGRATRLFDYLIEKKKTYIAEIAFGMSTDTQDAQGTVVDCSANIPNKESVKAVLPRFIGQIKQTPSSFSAIKQGGKPIYTMARRGMNVNVPERVVQIDTIDLLENTAENSYMLRVVCGRGVYIRTLLSDIGKAVGCPAYMRFLLRSASGVFMLDNAVTLQETAVLSADGRLKDVLMEMDWPLAYLERVDVPYNWIRYAKNGAGMPVCAFERIPAGEFRLYIEDAFAGIAKRDGDTVRFRTMLYGEDK